MSDTSDSGEGQENHGEFRREISGDSQLGEQAMPEGAPE